MTSRTSASRRLAGLCLALAVGTGIAACSDGPTSPASADYRLVYAYSPDNNTTHVHMWLATEDGAAPRQVDTLSGYFNENPAWSPDGARIAFSMTPLGPNGDLSTTATRQIVVMDLNGVVIRRIIQARNLDRPRWFPDGSRLLVTAGTGSARTLAIVNADGSGSSDIAGSGGLTGATLTPDATRIVANCGADICTLPVSGGTRTTLVTGGGNAAFSPDGRSMAWFAADGIRVSGVDGSGSRLVVASASVDQSAVVAWSHDGSSLVYTSVDGAQLTFYGNLYRVALSGGAPRNITGFADPKQLALTPDVLH